MLFVIRTAGDRGSRPSLPLIVTTLAVVAIGALLPYSPVAAALGLAALPAATSPSFVAVGTYLVIVEIVKGRVMRRLLPGPEDLQRSLRDTMKPGIIGSQ